jgi:hypothetical protein
MIIAKFTKKHKKLLKRYIVPLKKAIDTTSTAYLGWGVSPHGFFTLRRPT